MCRASPERRLITLALFVATFLVALDASVVSTAMPTVIGQIGGIELYAWVFSRLPAHQHRHRADLRQARRPVRTQARLPVLDRAVHGRLDAVRPGADDGAADRLPLAAGPGRGRRAADQSDHPRRPLSARGARAHHRPVQHDLGRLGPARPGDRRLSDRARQLALGLLRQFPAVRADDRADLEVPARAHPAPPPQHRLPGRGQPLGVPSRCLLLALQSARQPRRLQLVLYVLAAALVPRVHLAGAPRAPSRWCRCGCSAGGRSASAPWAAC